MASEELKRRAIEEAGLNKQQAESSTFEKTVDWLMDSNGKEIQAEMQRQIQEAKDQVVRMGRLYDSTAERMGKLYDNTLKKMQPLLDVHENSDGVTDERAKNALGLYAGLLNIIDNKFSTVDADKTINSLSYILWAYLGGQPTQEMLEIQKEQWSSPDQKHESQKAGRTLKRG